MAARKAAAKAPAAKTTKRRKRTTPSSGPVVAGLERDLARIRATAPDVAEGALAATALTLARELDKPRASATAKAAAARGLRDTLDRLRELAPPGEEEDSLNGLERRHAARRAGSAAA